MAFSILWLLPDDYRAVFIASLAAALFGLALLGLMVPDLRPRRAAQRLRAAADAPQREPATAPPRPSWRTLAEPRFGRVVAASAMLGLLTISDGFLYLSLQQRDDFAAKWFPLLFVGTNVVYLSVAVPFGRLSDRLGRAKVLVAGHVLLIGAYLCAVVPSGGVGLTLATLALLGAFYAATDGVLAALASALVPAPIRASGIATAQTVVAASRFASSLLFGALWTTLGRSPAVLVMAVALAVGVVGAWFLLRGVERTTRSTAEAAA
jgi:MFS family permease